jgi:nucleoside phosphorylase
MTALVFATQEEASPFLERYERGRFEELTEAEALMDERIVVTIVGTGKVKATLRTERFLKAHRPSRIIHVGLCVSLKETPSASTVVSMTQVMEGDRIEVAAPSYPRIPLESLGLGEEGVLVTQDHPLQEGDQQTYWQRIADHQDTTGYAVAYVAATHGIPTSILKAVGGHVGETLANLRQTRRRAAEALADAIIRALG